MSERTLGGGGVGVEELVQEAVQTGFSSVRVVV